MGLITGALRVQQLLNAKSDLEFNIQTATETKLGLCKSLSSLATAEASLDGPDSAAAKRLEEQKIQLQVFEKKIDAQLSAYNARLKMVETELESAKQLVDKNIQSSFTYGGR